MTTYADTGVDSDRGARALSALLTALAPTASNRTGIGRELLDVGYFATVLDLGGGRGLALACDGVGTKLLVAEAAEDYSSVGIDCIAMNVNDLICVGAEPIAMLDYLAVADPDPDRFAAIGASLAEGCRQAGISIPGGEVAQVADMLRGHRDDTAFDLMGTAIGVLDVDDINVGAAVAPGDAVIGVASNGLHSNGFSLVRRVLLGPKGASPEAIEDALAEDVPALGSTLAAELLRPTRIYVDLAKGIAGAGLAPHALCNITGDGLLNCLRVKAEATFVIDAHPEPPPIFGLVQETGGIDDAEMFRTFNMGVGFVLVVDPSEADATLAAASSAGYEASVIGRIEAGPREVRLPRWNLVGRDGEFSGA